MNTTTHSFLRFRVRISSTLHPRCPSHPASPRRPLIPNHRIILCGRQTRRRPKASRSLRRRFPLHVPISPRLAPACLEPSDYTPEFCRGLKMYWKSCSISKPWYGANMKGSFFTPSLTTWSVASTKLKDRETYPCCLCASPSLSSLLRVHDAPLTLLITIPGSGSMGVLITGPGEDGVWRAYEECTLVIPET
ncbi:hypothetical protein M422DRAFT_259194 [Sphaerobolus stellatus SS14]|uniref:Uncharacterized protein n=1 Tax=Sphaerobolus stellatus (strain SS14) TaxID=990650 RepID=A0A0C9VL47_SPHS4|nr:hypothetical protein M422DRAFT_259194 [Sphaerobolus stellatus SS14]